MTAGFIFPGQYIMQGSRIPPSHVVFFPSRSRPAEPPKRSFDKPWAVVGSENNKGVFRDSLLLESFENLADAPIQFFDDVTVNAAPAFAFEIFRGKKRNMRKGMGEIKEERFIFILLDEFNRFFGVAFCKSMLVGGTLDNFLVSHQGDIEPVNFRFGETFDLPCAFFLAIHIVAVRQAVEIIETLLCRQVLRQMAEMPFADAGACVASGFESFGDGDFTLRQTSC